jgi:hypothetical protein
MRATVNAKAPIRIVDFEFADLSILLVSSSKMATPIAVVVWNMMFILGSPATWAEQLA